MLIDADNLNPVLNQARNLAGALDLLSDLYGNAAATTGGREAEQLACTLELLAGNAERVVRSLEELFC